MSKHSVPRENLAFKKYNSFYRKHLLFPNNSLEYDAFLNPQIKELLLELKAKGIGNQLSFFSGIKTLKINSIMEHYWSFHSQQYLQRLKKLSTQILTNLVTNKTKAIIIIAAMNEVNIERAILAAKNAYEGDFEKEISVVVYHNYKTYPRKKVWEALSVLKSMRNVSVINEKVPEYNDVTMAKKIATDIVQLHIGNTLDIPFVLIDADAVMFTKKTINAAIAALQDKSIFAASALAYDLDPEVKEQFPVLKMICELDKKIGHCLVQQRYFPTFTVEFFTVGFFTAISRKTLAAVGGLKVLTSGADKKLLSLMSEDTQLTKDLYHLTAYDYFGFLHVWPNPIYPLRKYGYTIYLDASRDIIDLIEGKNRFEDDEYYVKISGTERKSIADIVNLSHTPELGSLTIDNLAKGLTRYIKNTFTAFPYDKNIISKLILSALYEMGYTATFSVTLIAVRNNSSRVEDPKLSVRLILDTNDWEIAEFKTVTKYSL